jgi:hypothetical protein
MVDLEKEVSVESVRIHDHDYSVEWGFATGQLADRLRGAEIRST